MTVSSANPSLEALSSKKSFLGPRLVVRIATWNVHTMFETGKAAQVTKEMERYKLDIVGVSEFRWTCLLGILKLCMEKLMAYQ